MLTFLFMIVHISLFTHGIAVSTSRQVDLVTQDGSGSEGTVSSISEIRLSSKRFNFTVPASAEPGYTVGRVTILQDDLSRDYSGVTFKLITKDDSLSKDYFYLEPKTGVIRVIKAGVDVMDTHLFIVTAVDSNSPTSPVALTVLTIYVVEGNFYSPVFTKMRYRAIVAFEVDKGTTILTVRATDKDHGENGMVTYTLLNPLHRNNIFRCKRNGEIANKKVFGVDRIGDYTLIIEGTDGGNPPKSSRTKVKIKVYDVRPRFLSTNYTFTISETEQVGSKIGVVAATSWQPSDEKANISYSIVFDEGNYFKINKSSGEISLARPLDSDFGSSYRLVVRVQEIGFALRTKDTIVTVGVIYDPAQNPTNSFTNISIPEDIPIDSQIYKFDYNMEVLSYSILNSSVDLPFMVGKESGVVFTTSLLDKERTSIYLFKVQIEGESFYKTVDMRVLIRDVNDNKPVFENCQAKIQHQDTTVGAEVIRLIVTDADILGDLSYYIKSGNIGNVIKAIEYKNGVSIAIGKEIELRQYDIEVAASDGTFVSVCNISIDIVNRNTPLFDDWMYNALIHEEQPIGKQVLQVHATDDDVGENGLVTYSMNFNPYFDIDQSTGEIFTIVNLDREKLDRHTFNVTASDGGRPPRQSWATVTVLVLDINDNRPRFLNLPYFGEVQENSNTSVSIITVEAIDDDNHTFGITYALRDDRFSIYFVIDKKTGEVKSRQGYSLDRELTPEFSLVVSASDGTYITMGSIHITVTDVDDNPPRFISPTQYKIQENGGIGVVGRVLLSDPDVEMSGPVSFRLTKPDSKFFSINTTTGVLSTKRNMRYRSKNKNVYRLEVVATCGRYTIRQPLLTYIIRNETSETATSAKALTLRNKNVSLKTTVYPITSASLPLKDDVTEIPALTYTPPLVSPASLEYTNTTTATTQMFIDMQTTPAAYQETDVPVTEPLMENITSTSAALLGLNTRNKTSIPDAMSHCSCDSYSDEERELTMKILQVKLETQETELRVRQMERRVTNMKLRYWTQQIKIAEERQIDCGTPPFKLQDVRGDI
ncbi:cadherin EGF LAG seven-pass G-type receptor 1-like isoform X2 [Anneissia japonica]|uniref:cadherin EGF LAG seven-pass G-type receptor 1-like isoform X2 n=1 Tax=Anneissia japonica TaxID=1529436 RepID=UPI001425A1D7|nr:cadherin EGF LAG seven-pass G-type receptor 1-like isoform X2 [Anneissia japonica]